MNLWLSIIKPVLGQLPKLLTFLSFFSWGRKQAENSQLESDNAQLKKDAEIEAVPKPRDRRDIYDRLRSEEDK